MKTIDPKRATRIGHRLWQNEQPTESWADLMTLIAVAVLAAVAAALWL